MSKGEKGNCPRPVHSQVPDFVRKSSVLCCRAAQFLNDMAVDVRQGAYDKESLDMAWLMAIDLGIPLKAKRYGKGEGMFEFTCPHADPRHVSGTRRKRRRPRR